MIVLLTIGVLAAAVMSWGIAGVLTESQAGRYAFHADRWYRDSIDVRDFHRSDGFARF